MLALASKLLSGIWAKLAIVGGVLLAGLLLVGKLMSAGRAQERADSLAEAARRAQAAARARANVDHLSSSPMFQGTPNGPMYRSDDGGRTWVEQPMRERV